MKNLIHFFLLISFFSFSQEEKRLALVIGNANYDKGELKNPVNDARLIASTLDSLDFDVILKENIENRSEFIRAIREFGTKRPDYDVAFVYYAGHGIQVDDENFLLPTKEEFSSEEDVLDFAVSVQNVMRYLKSQTDEVNILILDACRDNPFESSWNTTRSLKGEGLAKIPPPTGSLIAFSTDSGQTAPDGDGENSIYSISLAKNMLLEDTSIDQVFRNVRSEVLNQTNQMQRPVEATQLTGQGFYLLKKQFTDELIKVKQLYDNSKYFEAYEILNNNYNYAGLSMSLKTIEIELKILYKIEKYEELLTKSEQLLEQYPESDLAYYYISLANYFGDKNTQKALEYIEKAININSSNFNYYSLKSRIIKYSWENKNSDENSSKNSITENLNIIKSLKNNSANYYTNIAYHYFLLQSFYKNSKENRTNSFHQIIEDNIDVAISKDINTDDLKFIIDFHGSLFLLYPKYYLGSEIPKQQYYATQRFIKLAEYGKNKFPYDYFYLLELSKWVDEDSEFRLNLIEKALNLDKRNPDIIKEKAVLLYNLAYECYDLNYEESSCLEYAVRSISQSIYLLDIISDKSTLAEINQTIAMNYHYLQEDYELAIKYYKKTIADSRKYWKNYSRLSDVYQLNGNFNEALDYNSRAIQFLEQYDKKYYTTSEYNQILSNLYANKYYVQLNIEDYENAYKSIKERYLLNNERGQYDYIESAIYNDDLDAAMKISINEYEKTNDESFLVFQSIILNKMGKTNESKNLFENTIKSAEHVYKINKDLRFKRLFHICNYYFFLNNDFDNLIKYNLKEKDWFKEEYKYESISNYYFLSYAYLKSGHILQSFSNIEIAINNFESQSIGETNLSFYETLTYNDLIDLKEIIISEFKNYSKQN